MCRSNGCISRRQVSSKGFQNGDQEVRAKETLYTTTKRTWSRDPPSLKSLWKSRKKISRTAKFEVCNSFKYTENFVVVQISEILRRFVWEKLAIQQLFPIQILLPFPIFQLLPNLILNATGLGRSRDQVTHKNEFYWEKNLSNKKCRMTGLDTTPYQVIQTSTIFCKIHICFPQVFAWTCRMGAYARGRL